MKIKTASLLLLLALSLFGGLIVSIATYSLSNGYEIERSWNDFEELHSEKGRALNILRKEMGYGGVIHHFKNYVLRQEAFYADAVKFSFGGAKSAISVYRSLDLSEKEKLALNAIDQNLQSYRKSLPIISSLIKNNNSAREIDRLVQIDDTFALEGLIALLDKTQKHTLPPSKLKLMTKMRHAMGFGGMIHHFKNALLRSDAALLALARKDLLKAQQLTDLYLKFELNQAEQSAIRQIKNTLFSYSKKIEKLEAIGLNSASPEHIDRLVRISDKPALNAFVSLGKEIASTSDEAEKKLTQSLVRIIDAGQILIYLSVTATLALLFASYWLVRIQIINPILSLTDAVNNITQRNFDAEIYGLNKTDEIGEMARAIDVFKKDHFLLGKTKQELSTVNIDLEKKIIKRTRALRNSEGNLRAILATAVDAIITIDGHGNIKSYNRSAEDMFGFSSEEAIDKNVSLLIPGSLGDNHDGYMQSYLKTGKTNIIGTVRKMKACRKNGGVFPIHLSVSEVVSADGIFFVGIIRDVSDLEAYQKSLQVSEEIAVKANSAKSEFIANMNHELRTPMNAILGFSQLLEGDPNETLTESQKDSVDEIKAAGKHLLGIINQILELNKIEAGKTEVVMEKISPSELIQESLALITQMAEAQNVEIIDYIEYEKIPDLLADNMRFKQVLINLLSNAVKYNKNGGKITLSAERKGSEIRFCVHDTGSGIPLYRQAEIFVPFERIGKENSDIEGTGIGLAITKKLVELMQGNIGFESLEDEGSCFWFELPIYKDENVS